METCEFPRFDLNQVKKRIWTVELSCAVFKAPGMLWKKGIAQMLTNKLVQDKAINHPNPHQGKHANRRKKDHPL
jgi:hypothetical protein